MKTAAPSPAAHVRSLHGRIASVRRKRAAVNTATGIALALGVLAGVFTVEAVLDWFVDLPWLARALAFAGAFTGAGFLLWRDSIRPLRNRLHDDSVALIIEHALPAFSTRFIASVQLARASGEETPPSLVRALLAETDAMAARMDFGRVIKTARLKRALLMAGIVLAAALALAWTGRAVAPLLLERALLFNTPLPHKTHILGVTGDRDVGLGEDLKIEVTAAGALPASGELVTVGASGAKHTLALDRDPDQPGKFSVVVRSPLESFSYYVKLNDDTSNTYHVRTVRRPAVAEVACEQTYPAYVNLPPEKRSVGDLTLLVGSRLKISVRASMNIRKAALHLTGLETELPLQIDPKDSTRLSGTLAIPPKDLTGFSIHLVNTEGVDSGETATYRIDLVPDLPPTVAITYPARHEELATAQATLRVAFEAEDDFGVVKAELHYTIDQGAEKTIDFDLGGQPAKKVMRRFEWKLGSLQPPVAAGNTIEFWITVADNNNVTGPGIGTTEHYQIKIVSEEEKRLDIANRLRDTMGGLNDLTQSEEEVNNALGAVIFEKPKQNQEP